MHLLLLLLLLFLAAAVAVVAVMVVVVLLLLARHLLLLPPLAASVSAAPRNFASCRFSPSRLAEPGRPPGSASCPPPISGLRGCVSCTKWSVAVSHPPSGTSRQPCISPLSMDERIASRTSSDWLPHPPLRKQWPGG